MSILSVILILVGAIAIGRSALEARRLRRFLAPGRFQSTWSLLHGLMVVFFVGYLAVGVTIAAGLGMDLLIYAVGGIFLGGALFVHAITHVASQMVQSVIQTTPPTRPSEHDAIPVVIREQCSGTFRLGSGPKTIKNRRATLLIVDDSVLDREILVGHLHNHGYETLTAVDGSSALAVLRERDDIDLAIVDYWLPDMQGLDVLERIAMDRIDLPVIMLSGRGDAELVAACIEAGADDFLLRPVVPRLLRARIDNCLARRWYHARMEREKERSSELLRVILPEPIAHELSETNKVSPRRHEEVAVLFADISGFTAYCDKRQPEEVLARLQAIVIAFEELASRHGVQKIKTVGDSFMAASGLLTKAENPVLGCVQLGLAMSEAIRRLEPEWRVRVGVHIGPVVAGIVGRSQYLFDIWGDTVNTASRVESCGIVDRVCVSAQAWQRIQHLVRGSSLGRVRAKGKGSIELFQVDSVLPKNGYLGASHRAPLSRVPAQSAAMISI